MFSFQIDFTYDCVFLDGPHVRLYLENPEPVDAGDGVKLRCEVSAYPPYQTIQWLRQVTTRPTRPSSGLDR